MVEDKVEPREINWRHLLPWTAIFQGFRVALDLNKLMLAALGILAMAFAWWFLAWIFYALAGNKPEWPSKYMAAAGAGEEAAKRAEAWANFKADRQAWNVMHEAAGPGDSAEKTEPEDLADTATEFELLKAARDQRVIPIGAKLEDVKADTRAGRLKVKVADKEVAIRDVIRDEPKLDEFAAKTWLLRDPDHPTPKPAGRMRTWPWYEDRGSNPYLLVTGRAGQIAEDGTQRTVPWEKGHFVEWLATEQAPVLLEPLVKMLRPVIYFFSPRAGALARFYFLLVMLITVAIWGIIGGAITRIAAVQVARQEKIGAREALSFTGKRYLSFISAPIFPLVLVAVVVVGMIIFGLFFMIPILGDIVGSLLWFLMILAGLGIAVILVGLVAWPLMAATISAEGTDSWEAVSRSYSYIFQAPWHYLFYGVIALVYGAVLVFFVGFMGSAMVYFAKWGVNQVQLKSRDPSFLFVYAPTSFEWRDLLLQGYMVEGEEVWKNGRPTEAYEKLMNRKDVNNEANRIEQMSAWNYPGAWIATLWLWLVFLLILGFGYSYFWSASTIIYLLMRRKVDDTEMDEVYLEEEEQESPYSAGAPFTPPKPATPAPAPAGVTMVEAPTLRTPEKEEPAAPPPAASGDGSPPAESSPP